jgi:hypothetical protein
MLLSRRGCKNRVSRVIIQVIVFFVMHISLIIVEFLCSILIVIYTIIYDSKGLTSVRVLTISHLCILVGMVALNFAVRRIFNRCFKLEVPKQELKFLPGRPPVLR